MPSKPPVPSKENNPLIGIGISKIEFYGLQDIVRKLRNANMSYRDIAKELNTNYVGEDNAKISTMAVLRWCDDNINEDEIVKEEQTVNIYNELESSLEIVNKQINLLRSYIDSINKNIDNGATILTKDIKDLSGELDKFLARRQQLVTSIFTIQEKIYNFIAANDIVRETLEIVKDVDKTVYAEVIDRLKSNDRIREAMKRIEPINK